MNAPVIYDSLEPCPYLPDQQARLPLRYPLKNMTALELDESLASGDRRSGPFLYRPTCPACSACEALRVPVDRFVPSRSQRRVWRRNEGQLQVEVGHPAVSPRHLDIYKQHKRQRGLVQGPTDVELDAETYRLHFVQSRLDTREVSYLFDGELIAFSILDFGREGCSSVYHCFDPAHDRRSLGVYSVLKEIELCHRLGMRWYYLGLFVKACSHLAYKADYHPHQRRIAGQWVDFDQGDVAGSVAPVGESR